MWIKKPRQKTKVIADIPLLEVPLQILEKYRGQQAGGRLLPVCSNQKVNQYLKELATVCGINKELTYHVARYTFCHLAYPAARRTDGKYREDVGTYQYPSDTALRQSHQHTTQP